MKKSRKLKIWAAICGVVGLTITLVLVGLGIVFAGMSTIPGFVPFLMLGLSCALSISTFAVMVKLETLANKEINEEINKNKIPLIETFTNNIEKDIVKSSSLNLNLKRNEIKSEKDNDELML